MKSLILLTLVIAVSAQEMVPYLSVGSSGNNGLTTAAIAYYKFDEASGNATDYSGNTRTLTVNGSPVGDVAVVVAGRNFSATDNTDYLGRATEAAFSFTNIFTITCWASFNARSLAPNDMTIAARGDWLGANFSWWLFLDHGSPDDSMYFYYSTTGTMDFTKYVKFQFVGEIGSGFNFITVRCDGTTLKMSVTHINETALKTESTASFTGPIYNGTPTLRVGESESDTTHDMGGIIDELGFWARYLDDCQLNKLFNAKSAVFSWSQFDSGVCY